MAGEDWPRLSREYKLKKREEGAVEKPNMDLHGDMLQALDFKETDEGIKIGFFGDQAPKADGHLKFSGKENNTPQRRFIPAEGQKFRGPISETVQDIVGEASVGVPGADSFEGVGTAAEFWSAAREVYPGLSRTEIRLAVLNSQTLIDFFDDLGLMEYLE